MRKFEELSCILLIDDDDATNFYNRLIIEELGIDTHIESVPNGKIAIDYLNSSNHYSEEEGFPQPGIVFLDINMPIMNGWEFLDEYKKLPENRKGKMVIAMLTTSMNPEDEKKAKKLKEISHYFHKPLSEDYLRKTIEENFKEILP